MKTLRNVRVFERMQTTDALLTPPTDEELMAYFNGRAKMDPGRVYGGISRVLGAMKAADRDVVLKRLDAAREIGELEGKTQTDPTREPGSAKSTTDGKLRDIREKVEFMHSLNEQAAKRWAR